MKILALIGAIVLVYYGVRIVVTLMDDRVRYIMRTHPRIFCRIILMMIHRRLMMRPMRPMPPEHTEDSEE